MSPVDEIEVHVSIGTTHCSRAARSSVIGQVRTALAEWHSVGGRNGARTSDVRLFDDAFAR